MPRFRFWPSVLLLALIATAVIMGFGNVILCRVGYVPFLTGTWYGSKCHVHTIVSSSDNNHNSVPDALDIIAGAREEVQRRTAYDASYYPDGYPPEGRGACTDLVWRALAKAGYNLKSMVDEDIRVNPAAYGITGQQPDPNIDFRRVTNLAVFFQRHAQRLTTEVKPGDASNLVHWQPGDIVVFGPPSEHIGIISDRRRRDGVPLVLHNAGPWATEADCLLRWPSKITHHFRFP